MMDIDALKERIVDCWWRLQLALRFDGDPRKGGNKNSARAQQLIAYHFYDSLISIFCNQTESIFYSVQPPAQLTVDGQDKWCQGNFPRFMMFGYPVRLLPSIYSLSYTLLLQDRCWDWRFIRFGVAVGFSRLGVL